LPLVSSLPFPSLRTHPSLLYSLLYSLRRFLRAKSPANPSAPAARRSQLSKRENADLSFWLLIKETFRTSVGFGAALDAVIVEAVRPGRPECALAAQQDRAELDVAVFERADVGIE
jgi:hypothetical protein